MTTKAQRNRAVEHRYRMLSRRTQVAAELLSEVAQTVDFEGEASLAQSYSAVALQALDLLEWLDKARLRKREE